MTHPILALQAALVPALRDALQIPVFDAPPNGAAPPYVAIARHDVLPRDGDGAPGHEHRLLLSIRGADAARRPVVEIAETALATALAVSPDGLTVTLARHVRTETSIDAASGRARAALSIILFTEPS